MNSKKSGLGVPIGILIALSLMFLIHDIWMISIHEVGINKWWPFFLPALFACSAFALWRFTRLTPEQQGTMRDEAAANSCLNPANTNRQEGIE